MEDYIILDHAGDVKCTCGCGVMDHRLDGPGTCQKCDCKQFRPTYKRSDYPELIDSGQKECGRSVLVAP